MYLFFSPTYIACQFEYEATPSFSLVCDIALLLQSGGPNRNYIQNILTALDSLFKEKQNLQKENRNKIKIKWNDKKNIRM